jgi:effector-binding domain-containing protein
MNDYKVTFESVEAHPMAGVTARASHAELGTAIMAGLDKVYGVLRAEAPGPLGCNVVLYGPGWGGRMDLRIGVRLDAPYAGNGVVKGYEIPGGDVAHVVYFGDYARMHPAHEAAQKAALESGRGLTGASWEVYGDWSDDPAKLRTDIYYQLGEAK